MGKKKKAKPPEKRKRNIFEIRQDAYLRKLAELLKRRERLLDRLSDLVLEESYLEFETRCAITRLLVQGKK